MLAVLVLGLAAAAGYWFACRASTHRRRRRLPPSGRRIARCSTGTTRCIRSSRFDKPGKSPFMDMQLVPKYADAGGDEGGVSVSPRVVQNLGVRTVEAKRGIARAEARAVGSVEYNERSFVVVQPRAAGFVERLHVRAPLDPVRQGDPLVEILFPDWAAAQEEYLR